MLRRAYPRRYSSSSAAAAASVAAVLKAGGQGHSPGMGSGP